MYIAYFPALSSSTADYSVFGANFATGCPRLPVIGDMLYAHGAEGIIRAPGLFIRKSSIIRNRSSGFLAVLGLKFRRLGKFCYFCINSTLASES